MEMHVLYYYKLGMRKEVYIDVITMHGVLVLLASCGIDLLRIHSFNFFIIFPGLIHGTTTNNSELWKFVRT